MRDDEIRHRIIGLQEKILREIGKLEIPARQAAEAFRQLADALEPFAEDFAIEEVLNDAVTVYEVARIFYVPVEFLADHLRLSTEDG